MAVDRDLKIGAIGGIIGAIVPIIGAAFFFGGLSKDVDLSKGELTTLSGRVDSLRKDTKGEQGVAGTQGAQGNPGNQGLKGEPGLQGIQGLQGTKGDPGPEGPRGLQGVKGDKGDAGKENTPVIAGHYNGGGLDNLTSGSNLRSMIVGSLVRIVFDSYNFRSRPIVLITNKDGQLTYIQDLTNDHVDGRIQTLIDGHTNGNVVTNGEFWFQVIPTS